MKNAILRSSFVSLILILPSLVSAAVEGGANPNFFSNLFFYMIAGASAVIVLLVLGALFQTFNTIVRMREAEYYKEQGITDYLDTAESQPSWWEQLSNKLTDAVPVDHEREVLLDHNYDGIRELDNNLPPWWVYGFYLTIGIAVFYIGFYHFSSYAKSSQELYEIEMQEAQEEVNQYLAMQVDKIDEDNLEVLTDEEALAAGKTIFNTSCATCHLETGGGAPGSIGPNLTDEYWLHGGGIKNIFSTIKYGVPEKGMISWKAQLRPSDMHKVASYIMSLQGTNPPNAKAPQGELYVAEARE